MQGQAQIIAVGATVTVVVVMTLLGLTIYGMVATVYPHDQTLTNESMCTTCVNSTLYRFDNIPIINDTTLICFNDSADLMTNGAANQACLGYSIEGNTDFNMSNTSVTNNCSITNVVCTYVWNEAGANEQSFYDNNTSITFSGFTLLSIAGIIIAAVAIVMLVLLLKG